MDKSYDYDYETEYDYTWDDQYYGTGNTEPPKQRSGAMALMLILVIFLFGIITVLGVLNVKLFQELKMRGVAAGNGVAVRLVILQCRNDMEGVQTSVLGITHIDKLAV